jgi:hypothetical protein
VGLPTDGRNRGPDGRGQSSSKASSIACAMTRRDGWRSRRFAPREAVLGALA